jgi:hypothetical protein
MDLKSSLWCLVEISPLKVPILYFDLEPCFDYVQFNTTIGGFISENYEKTLVIKVSEISFSKLRDKEKSYTRPTQYPLHHKCG